MLSLRSPWSIRLLMLIKRFLKNNNIGNKLLENNLAKYRDHCFLRLESFLENSYKEDESNKQADKQTNKQKELIYKYS